MFVSVETFPSKSKEIVVSVTELKTQFSHHNWQNFSLGIVRNHGNVDEQKKIGGSFERNTKKNKEQSITKNTWSRNGTGVQLPSFWRDLRESN